MTDLRASQPGKRRDKITSALREDAETPRIVDAAVAEFHERHGAEKLAPLIVVVPALNEEPSIGPVVDEVPDTICDLPVQVLVVDDGSSDATSDKAREHGALVCRLGRNRGQGTAFRTGYRIAREGGARYVATLDADG